MAGSRVIVYCIERHGEEVGSCAIVCMLLISVGIR